MTGKIIWIGQKKSSVGQPEHKSAGMMFGGILNLILDPIFMFAVGMGFVGSAVATACSNLASVLFFLIIFYRLRGKTNLSLSIRNFSIKFARPILLVGIASAMMTVLANASNMVIVKLASGYGKRTAGYIYDSMPSGTFEHSLPSSHELVCGSVWNDMDAVDY